MLGFSAIADAPIAGLREDQYLILASQALTFSLSSVALTTNNTLDLTGLSCTALVSPILWNTDAVLGVSGFSITSDLNSFRQFWVDIFTVQIPNTPYDNGAIASTPICYTQPEPPTDPNIQGTWDEIGYNVPASLWTPVTTTQTSNWVDVPT